MTALYELLGNVLTAIAPRNERARTWLDKGILRAHLNARGTLNPIFGRASVSILRKDFQYFRMAQGEDGKHKELYEQVEHLLEQLEGATAAPFDDPRRWERRQK